MEIEIITTKRKLTKSIVNQMRLESMLFLDMVETGTILGKILNIRKGAPCVYLVSFSFGYGLISDDLYFSSSLGIRSGTKDDKSRAKSFDSEESCKAFMQKLKNIRRRTPQLYI